MSEIDDATKARMVMMNGLGYDYHEIADELEVSKSSVGKYVNRFENRARSSGEWEKVYWEAVLPAAFDDAFMRMIASDLS